MMCVCFRVCDGAGQNLECKNAKCSGVAFGQPLSGTMRSESGYLTSFVLFLELQSSELHDHDLLQERADAAV